MARDGRTGMGRMCITPSQIFRPSPIIQRPNKKPKYNSIDEVDPELLDTFKRLGISLDEQKKLAGVAVDIVMDSVSVATTFKKTLGRKRDYFLLYFRGY
jgi:Fe-S cluster assembly scaffold protein SufB